MRATPLIDVVRFGPFRLDLKTGELYRGEGRVRLQEQPFQILKMLLERPGEVVTREGIRKALWSDDTIVEFENSVHAAIKKLRVALEDSADSPSYIETLPRKGYRFICPVAFNGPIESAGLLSVAPATSEPLVSLSNQDRGLGHDRPQELRRRTNHAWLVAAASVLVIAAGCIYWIWTSRRGAHEPSELPPVSVPLTTYFGNEGEPTFSPDGNQVAFVWGGEKGENSDVYIKQVGTEARRRLTTDPGIDVSPAWSPDGQSIAFVRYMEASKSAVMVMAENGGRERQLAEVRMRNVPLGCRRLSWHPGGKWLAVARDYETEEGSAAIYLLSVETGEMRPLTSSARRTNATMQGDTNPAFSPDGRNLAFVRFSSVNYSELFLLRLAEGLLPEGEAKQLTIGKGWTATPTWTPDGKELIYAFGDSFFAARLWRISLSDRRPRALPFSGTITNAEISPQTGRLVYKEYLLDFNIWRCPIPSAQGFALAQARLMASTKPQLDPQFSPDGSAIAYVSSASGVNEVWVCDQDGSNPMQVTRLGGPSPKSPRWSPDGRRIVFTAEGNVCVVAAQGGPSKQLTHTTFSEEFPSYSRNGKWIYFDSAGGGSLHQVWKMPADGGEAIRVAKEGGCAQESTNGEEVYYLRAKDKDLAELWKIPVSGGEETRVLEEVFHANFDVKEGGIYYAAQPDRNTTQFLFYDFASRRSKPIATTQQFVTWGLSVSPTEKWILWTQTGWLGSDLVLVENFR